MHILQLELIAFGAFTNKILDFSTQAPCLHIIYGDNEAGKSTVRRALAYLLFGIPERTTDAYVHNNEQLRIGAHLGNGHAETLHCYRRKGRKNTLLDADSKPLEEAHLQNFLGGITEAQFNALFCFDHERLRQGGEALLVGKGEVGESLFKAGAGGVRVHEVLTQLDREAEELFKARGSKPLLNQKIKAYKEACKRIKENSLPASKWSEQANLLEQARQQHAQLTKQLQVLRAEQHRLARIQRTRPLLQRRQELHEELARLQAVVILPDDAMSKRFEVSTTLRTAQAQEQQAILDSAQLQSQLDSIHIPEALMAQSAMIDDLRGRLGSHQKAARDLPGVRTELRTVEGETQVLLQRLYPDKGLDNIPVLTLTTREHINQLVEQHPILQEKYHSLTKRLEDLNAQQAQQQHALDNLPPIPDATLLQVNLTRALKHSDLEDKLAKEEQALALVTEKTTVDLKQLGLWSGSLADLEQISLPTLERIEGFERRFKELEDDKQRIKERLLEARQQDQRATQKLNALRWAGDVPTEAMLSEARHIRQCYWQQLRQSKYPQLSFTEVTTPTSDGVDEIYQSFEKAMLQADELADRLRREAHRVAEYGVLLAEQDNAQREQGQQAKKWHLMEELAVKLQVEWEACWASLNIKPWSPTEMRGWLADCVALRQQAQSLRAQHQIVAVHQQTLADLTQALQQALIPLKSSTTSIPLMRLSDLIDQSQVELAAVERLQRQHEDLEKQIAHLTYEHQRVEKVQQQALEALEQWQTAWQQVLLPLQLPTEASLEVVRDVLTTLDQIVNKLDKIKSLQRRVTLMEKDASAFQQDVRLLAQTLMPALVEAPVEQVVPTFLSQLSQAEKDVTRFEQLQQRLQTEQQRRNQAHQQVQLAQAQLQALLEQAHCHDLTELETAELASLHKKELQRELADVEQQLLEQGEGLSLVDLAQAAAEVNIDQLPGQLQSYGEQIQQLEQERSEIDQQIGASRTLLRQMDGNAAAAQAADEAQLTLAEMQNLSERYMQIHLAASVLRKSIERYREHHQGPLLKRASALFEQLTLGNFRGLKPDYAHSDDQPTLLGLPKQSETGVPTPYMSDGTRDQLYLALRLASIEHYLEKNMPLPLILDDILVNFDDDRSQATLMLLSTLCQRTQILFFTHHTRLLDLVQTAIPQERFKIHRL